MTETGPEENRARVVAVIPAYEPGPNLVDLVRCLSEQVTTVVVVDDGSPTWPDIPQRAAVVVRHDSNRGIGAALNTGIREALTDADVMAVLTVDQDSQLPARFVRHLLDTWRDAESAGVRVGLVAPQKVIGQPDQRPGRPPIQSGQLIPVTTLRRVGDFDERLFIDGVDDDYALRCLDAGLALVVSEGLTIGHRLGAIHDVTIAGRTVTLTRSAPFRYYYLTRNRLWLVRRNARRHPRWAVAQAFGLLRHLVVVQTLVPDRRVRADAVWRGARDALRP